MTERLSQWFALTAKLLNTGYTIAHSAGPKLKSSDNRNADIQFYAVSLIARSLSNMRGVTTMIHEKRSVEAAILSRCILENLFWIVGFAEKPQKFRKIAVDHDLKRNGLSIENLFKGGKLPDRTEEFLRKWMRNNNSWKTAKSSEPKKLATEIGFEDAYLFYDHLSQEAHPTITGFNRYVVSRDKTGITEIDLAPEPDEFELEDAISMGCYGLVTAIIAGCKIFESEYSQIANQLGHEYLYLMQQKSKLTMRLEKTTQKATFSFTSTSASLPPCSMSSRTLRAANAVALRAIPDNISARWHAQLQVGTKEQALLIEPRNKLFAVIATLANAGGWQSIFRTAPISLPTCKDTVPPTPAYLHRPNFVTPTSKSPYKHPISSRKHLISSRKHLISS